MNAPLDLTISDEAFAYLRLQRGAISDLSNDRKAWETAYRRSLLGDFATMQKWLPERCGAIMDVGSGLGGINILLARHYDPSPEIWLLDGDGDKPSVSAHDHTFNDMVVATKFLMDNNLSMTGFFRANKDMPSLYGALPPRIDLLVSLQAWCFHFPPSAYLDFIRPGLNPGATLILDVRKDKTDWREELRDAFTEVGIAVSAHKFDRVVFKNGL
jgi:hypothetical protein